MREYVQPQTEAIVHSKKEAAEIDLRKYLVWLAQQGILASIEFREGPPPTEAAQRTVEVVQYALGKRRETLEAESET